MYSKLFYFAIFLLVGCGTQQNYSTLNAVQIVNGIEIDDSEMPAIVQVSFKVSGGVAKCTGTFVSPSTLLTAAHCTEFNGRYTDNMKIETGPAAGKESLKILRHPQYRANRVDYDLAVVIFVEDTSTDYIAMSAHAPEKADEIMIVGYGRPEFDRTEEKSIKRKGYNHVERIDSRLSFYSEGSVQRSPGEDACNALGDSGGPMLLADAIVGVSSTISRPRGSSITTGNYTNLYFAPHLQFLQKAVLQHGADIRGLAR